MNEVIDRLLAAGQALQARPVDGILAALERVVSRWLDRSDPIRREAEARIGAGTGLAPAMLRDGLDQMVGRVLEIGPVLDQDLGSRYALDRFVERGAEGGAGSGPGGGAPPAVLSARGRRPAAVRSRAWGPGLTVCIFSGNVPGIPAFDMALALALKSACLARPASGEPVFAELFARSVAEVDPELGRCLAVARWDYSKTLPLRCAGAVIAYGSDETVEAIRRQVPAGTRFAAHGHKVGVAAVAREACTAETAALLARDVALYDQQGCVSPQIAFVERGGPLSPTDFARACAGALEALELEMPRAPLAQPEALALRRVRDEAEFTADALFASAGNLAWTVVHTETPAFAPSPLNRLLRTAAVPDLDHLAGLLTPVAPYLQTVAFAGPPERGERLAEALGRLGASRLCPVGRVQEPSGLWRHDGRPTAGDLIRWLDVEAE